MKNKTLPTLLDMKDEVGFALFNLWKQGAEHHLKPSYWEHAECRHSAEYGFILRAYLEYKNVEKEKKK